MFARLAFSVAISIEPEILIVDEALSVGDVFFRISAIENLKNYVQKELRYYLYHMILVQSSSSVLEFCGLSMESR